MTDTSLVFNILAKDKASQVFNQFRLSATMAFDGIATRAKDFAKSSIDAFTEGERSQLLLQDAFSKFPKLADTNIDKMRELDEQTQATTKFDHNMVAEAQAKLAMFNFTGQQIEALTPLMADFAAKTGGDMTTAATIFGKAMVGQGRGLKQVGIDFKNLGDPTKNYLELQSKLNEKVGGFAAKEGKTAADQAIILKNEYKDLQEKIGGALVPVLQKLVPPLMQIFTWMDKNSSTVMKVLGVVGSLIGIIWVLNAAVRAYTTVQIALNIVMSMNPIGLIIIAIGLLVIAFVVLWKKSAAFREFWIGLWNEIKFQALTVKDAVVHGFDAVVSFFANLPRRIGNALGSLGGIIGGVFKDALNGVVWYINFWISGVDAIIHGINKISGVVGIPSIPDIPQVPRLAAGGIVTRPTLALVGEKGPEAVVPLSRGGLGGELMLNLQLLDSDGRLLKRIRQAVRVNGGKGSNSVQIAFG